MASSTRRSIPGRTHHGHDSRHGKQGESRIPATTAVVVAIVLYALLPGSLQLGPRLLVPIVEAVLLAAVVATDPRRITGRVRWARGTSLVLIGIVVLTNLIALGLLIRSILDSEASEASDLLLAALQVWATNVIAFALIYWELDRGGPVARARLPRDELPLADFRFSHDEDRDTVDEVRDGSSEYADWVPNFVDYLYVSTTNSSAFSPTDTMPLTSRAKMLMALQATSALITSLLVIARAVGALQ